MRIYTAMQALVGCACYIGEAASQPAKQTFMSFSLIGTRKGQTSRQVSRRKATTVVARGGNEIKKKKERKRKEKKKTRQMIEYNKIDLQ